MKKDKKSNDLPKTESVTLRELSKEESSTCDTANNRKDDQVQSTKGKERMQISSNIKVSLDSVDIKLFCSGENTTTKISKDPQHQHENDDRCIISQLDSPNCLKVPLKTDHSSLDKLLKLTGAIKKQPVKCEFDGQSSASSVVSALKEKQKHKNQPSTHLFDITNDCTIIKQDITNEQVMARHKLNDELTQRFQESQKEQTTNASRKKKKKKRRKSRGSQDDEEDALPNYQEETDDQLLDFPDLMLMTIPKLQDDDGTRNVKTSNNTTTASDNRKKNPIEILLERPQNINQAKWQPLYEISTAGRIEVKDCSRLLEKMLNSLPIIDYQCATVFQVNHVAFIGGTLDRFEDTFRIFQKSIQDKVKNVTGRKWSDNIMAIKYNMLRSCLCALIEDLNLSIGEYEILALNNTSRNITRDKKRKEIFLRNYLDFRRLIQDRAAVIVRNACALTFVQDPKYQAIQQQLWKIGTTLEGYLNSYIQFQSALECIIDPESAAIMTAFGSLSSQAKTSNNNKSPDCNTPNTKMTDQCNASNPVVQTTKEAVGSENQKFTESDSSVKPDVDRATIQTENIPHNDGNSSGRTDNKPEIPQNVVVNVNNAQIEDNTSSLPGNNVQIDVIPGNTSGVCYGSNNNMQIENVTSPIDDGIQISNEPGAPLRDNRPPYSSTDDLPTKTNKLCGPPYFWDGVHTIYVLTILLIEILLYWLSNTPIECATAACLTLIVLFILYKIIERSTA